MQDKAGLRLDDEILLVNGTDFTELKIHEALEFLLHIKSAHLRIRRAVNQNRTNMMQNVVVGSTNQKHPNNQQQSQQEADFNINRQKEENNNLHKIQIARSTLFETFGFTVKSLIENDEFKKLMVTK